METATQHIVEEQNKLLVAASWKPANLNTFGVDGTYHAFCEVMEYRRAVAARLLETPDGASDKEYLKEMFEDCNTKIKQVLGL